MGKVLDIAAFGNLSVAVGYDGTIYVWGKFFYENYSNTSLSMKFSRIHELFVYNDLRITHKPLTVFTNNYKYVEEILDILESVGAAFDDPVCFLLLHFFTLYSIKLNINNTYFLILV